MKRFSYLYYRGLFNAAPWIITAIAVALLAFHYDASAQRPIAVNPGRYQLFTGTYNGSMDGKTTETTSLLKIDTETGITWFYLQRADAKTADEGWVQIPNLVKRR